ncbi:MAG: DUF2795 domain-containing protein [Pseudomonadota bacterium]|nr:DUF2795 domain-containing protein [Pseudomonadota bacterium]
MAQSPINITHHLKGIDFPARRQDLERHAKNSGAGEDVLAAIKAMPDHEYGSMADVMKGFGEEH